jgi:myo-inositol-1(or 4)-monophosphatase
MDAQVLAGELEETAGAAARKAGAELLARFGATPTTPSDRLAEASVASVLAHRRPDDGILGRHGICDRSGSSGVRWIVEPLDGAGGYARRLPLWCVALACEDAAGTLVGVIHDPVRGETFAAARERPATLDGRELEPGPAPALATATLAADVATSTDDEAKRLGKLARRLFADAGERRSLGSAALELAWTAAGRFDLCYLERRVGSGEVDAGLFLCQRAGLRVHRLAPLRDGLAPRFVVAPPALAGEVLERVGPPANQRREAAQRPGPSPESVRRALRLHRR